MSIILLQILETALLTEHAIVLCSDSDAQGRQMTTPAVLEDLVKRLSAKAAQNQESDHLLFEVAWEVANRGVLF